MANRPAACSTGKRPFALDRIEGPKSQALAALLRDRRAGIASGLLLALYGPLAFVDTELWEEGLFLLFLEPVRLLAGKGTDQGSLAMVNMANRSHVNVRFCSLKLLLCHECTSSSIVLSANIVRSGAAPLRCTNIINCDFSIHTEDQKRAIAYSVGLSPEFGSEAYGPRHGPGRTGPPARVELLAPGHTSMYPSVTCIQPISPL